MKKKAKRKKSEPKAPTEWFHELLKRAAQPLSKEVDEKSGRKNHGDYMSKRTRQRKAEDVE